MMVNYCHYYDYYYYERNVVLYALRCLKSNEDMILALAGQFKQLSHEQWRAGQFVGFMFSRERNVISYFI